MRRHARSWPPSGLIAAFLLAVLVLVGTARSAAAEVPVLVLRPALGALPVPDITRFWFGPEPPPVPELEGALPRLRLERIDGELIEVTPFDRFGSPDPRAFAQVAHAFRSKSGDEVAVDARLVELLLTLSRAFDDKPIRLVSGHRTPGRGTRKTSYHVQGMAADIAIVGVPVRELRAAAIRLGARGVGLYPAFVHVDVRDDRPYRWAGGFGRRRR